MPSSPPCLYAAITNHGFGHATRTAAVLATVQKIRPDIRLILATTAPRWLLEAYLKGPYEYHACALDVGVIQSDSLTMDLAATGRALNEIRDRQIPLIQAEAEFIQQEQVGLVFADIPPLAAPIAQAAGVPCWMASNFGWDFIYRDWGAEFADICRWIEDCFGQCDRLFRLPFHEPMAAFSTLEDVGFTGGDPAYDPEVLRQKLGITAPRERTVLLTFGGLSLQQIPYERLTEFSDWQFLTFDRKAPDLPNLLRANDPAANLQLRPVDLMPLCHCVVSKPGYSTFSEACRQQTPIISLRRAGFAEAPILQRQMPQVVPHRLIEPAEFFEGNWSFLRQPLEPIQRDSASPDPNIPPTDGNQVIAEAIAHYFQ